MLNHQHQRPSTSHGDDHHQDQDQEDQTGENEQFRDIHALTPPHPAPSINRGRRRETWETSSHRSSSMSMAGTDGGSSDQNFTSISREFNALVLAGAEINNNDNININDHNNYHETSNLNPANNNNNNSLLARIGEDDMGIDDDHDREETNPLAIVPDPAGPISPRRVVGSSSTHGSTSSNVSGIQAQSDMSVQRVKKEEVETKISAWQNAKISKINNRFKREDAVIHGWENEEVQKASSWMKKIERKLEEKKARAEEKMLNKVAKAHRKAEERRASAEAKRGTKVARVLEVANLMRAVGRAPTKRSFF